MDIIRKYAEKHGWTPDNRLCSYDFVTNLLPKSVRKTCKNLAETIEVIKHIDNLANGC